MPARLVAPQNCRTQPGARGAACDAGAASLDRQPGLLPHLLGLLGGPAAPIEPVAGWLVHRTPGTGLGAQTPGWARRDKSGQSLRPVARPMSSRPAGRLRRARRLISAIEQACSEYKFYGQYGLKNFCLRAALAICLVLNDESPYIGGPLLNLPNFLTSFTN